MENEANYTNPFRNTVQDYNGNVFECNDYATLKDARKAAKATAKKFGMIRHCGHVVNYTDFKELFTNY